MPRGQPPGQMPQGQSGKEATTTKNKRKRSPEQHTASESNPTPRKVKRLDGESTSLRLSVEDPRIFGHLVGAANALRHRALPICTKTAVGVTVSLCPTEQYSTQVSTLVAGTPAPSVATPGNRLPMPSASRTWVIPSGQEDEFASYFSDLWLSQGCPALANNQTGTNLYLNKLGYYYAFNNNTGPIAAFVGQEWSTGVLPYTPIPPVPTSYGKSLSVVVSKKARWTFSCSSDVIGYVYADSIANSVVLDASGLDRDLPHVVPLHENRAPATFNNGCGYQSTVGSGPNSNPANPDPTTNGLYRAYVNKLVTDPIVLRPGVTVIEMDCSFPGVPPTVDSWYMLLDRSTETSPSSGPVRTTQDWAQSAYGAVFASLTAGQAQVKHEVFVSYASQPLAGSLFEEHAIRPHRLDHIPSYYFGGYGWGYDSTSEEKAKKQAIRELLTRRYRESKIDGSQRHHEIAMATVAPGARVDLKPIPGEGHQPVDSLLMGAAKGLFNAAGSVFNSPIAKSAMSAGANMVKSYMTNFLTNAIKPQNITPFLIAA